jgi:hypothetical protein
MSTKKSPVRRHSHFRSLAEGCACRAGGVARQASKSTSTSLDGSKARRLGGRAAWEERMRWRAAARRCLSVARCGAYAGHSASAWTTVSAGASGPQCGHWRSSGRGSGLRECTVRLTRRRSLIRLRNSTEKTVTISFVTTTDCVASEAEAAVAEVAAEIGEQA